MPPSNQPDIRGVSLEFQHLHSIWLGSAKAADNQRRLIANKPSKAVIALLNQLESLIPPCDRAARHFVAGRSLLCSPGMGLEQDAHSQLDGAIRAFRFSVRLLSVKAVQSSQQLPSGRIQARAPPEILGEVV